MESKMHLENQTLPDLVIDTTRLSEKGQVVIPKDIREKLRLTQGSRFLIMATGDSIVLQRVEFASERLKAKDLIEKARAIVQKLGFG